MSAPSDEKMLVITGILCIIIGILPTLSGIVSGTITHLIAGLIFLIAGILLIKLGLGLKKGKYELLEGNRIHKIGPEGPQNVNWDPIDGTEDKSEKNDPRAHKYIKCPHCDAINDDSDEICHSCQKNLH